MAGDPFVGPPNLMDMLRDPEKFIEDALASEQAVGGIRDDLLSRIVERAAELGDEILEDADGEPLPRADVIEQIEDDLVEGLACAQLVTAIDPFNARIVHQSIKGILSVVAAIKLVARGGIKS